VPLNGNPNGTRGDGTDYDENLVVTATRNFLTCRERAGTGKVTGTLAAGSLEGVFTLKLRRKTPFDPVTNGMHVTLGVPGAAPALQDELTGFRLEGRSATYQSRGPGGVRALRLDGIGKQTLRMHLSLADLGADVFQRRLELRLDSGDVCFRRPLRCKARGDVVRCR
jgi:hypothetical protein